MMDINKVILVGRLGADPIRRETRQQLPVTHFSVATSYRRNKEDEKNETQWHRVVTWGNTAENCWKFLRKGDAVYLEGYLKSTRYQSKEGHEKTSFEIHVSNISFLSSLQRAQHEIPEELDSDNQQVMSA